MSIRKIWIGVLLQQHDIPTGERLLYERALALMTEKEANDVVLLLERSHEDVPDAEQALTEARVLLMSKVEAPLDKPVS